MPFSLRNSTACSSPPVMSVYCAAFSRAMKSFTFRREHALLRIGRARALVERSLRDDVLLAEAAGVDARHRKGIRRLEPRQRVEDHVLGLAQLAAVGAGGVEQQVHARVAGDRRGLAARDQQDAPENRQRVSWRHLSKVSTRAPALLPFERALRLEPQRHEQRQVVEPFGERAEMTEAVTENAQHQRQRRAAGRCRPVRPPCAANARRSRAGWPRTPARMAG